MWADKHAAKGSDVCADASILAAEVMRALMRAYKQPREVMRALMQAHKQPRGILDDQFRWNVKALRLNDHDGSELAELLSHKEAELFSHMSKLCSHKLVRLFTHKQPLESAKDGGRMGQRSFAAGRGSWQHNGVL